jgi:peptidoglycan hydrolase CwlO-like protein
VEKIYPSGGSAMDDTTKELKKLEEDLRDLENRCTEKIYGNPYNKKMIQECGEKIESLKNEISRSKKEDFKTRARQLREEIDRLREENEKTGSSDSER